MNECRGGKDFPQHLAVANGTALHWAVYYRQLEITQLLLEKRAGIYNLVNMISKTEIVHCSDHSCYKLIL